MLEKASSNNILNKARLLMDEAGVSPVSDDAGDSSIFTEDTISLETYLKGVLQEALRAVFLVAPLYKIAASSLKGDKAVFQLEEFTGFSFVISDSGYGVITLPNNFLRFSSMQLTSWKRPVFEIQEHGSSLWKQQYVPETEAGVYKPVCNWVDLKEHGRCIEVHPIKKFELQAIIAEFEKGEEEGKAFLASSVKHFTYIPIPYVNFEANFIKPNIDSTLSAAAAYMCASLVCDIYEKPEQSQVFRERAIEIAKS